MFLILTADSAAAASLRDQVVASFPDETCDCVHRLHDARSVMHARSIDLLVSGIDIPDGDVVDLLSGDRAQSRRIKRVLIVTWQHPFHIVSTLRLLAVDGVFDLARESLDRFENAVRAVCRGERYWSEGVLQSLWEPNARALLHQLTPTEELALATLGDGCGDKVAAQRLGMTFSTTRAVRRDLYVKLGIHDRSELIRMAVRHGYVRFTPEGAFPVGLGILRSRHGAVSKRAPRSRGAMRAAPAPAAAKPPLPGNAPSEPPSFAGQPDL